MDDDLKKIKGLKWLPWVGDRFNSISPENKLLIVGESHYHDGPQSSIDKHESPTFTREIVKEFAVDRNYYDVKIFPSLHKALFANDEFDTDKFWNLTAFYNFVQRVMNKEQGERPNPDDFHQGWLNFFELIKVLKPKTCLFVGVTVSNFLERAISESNFRLKESIVKDDLISRTRPRRATLIDDQNREIKLFFIQHTSRYFSWKKWNEYLQEKIPNLLNWFSEQLNKK